MSIAKTIREHLSQTGQLQFPKNARAVAFNYGDPEKGQLAFVFEDGSELSVVIRDQAIQAAYASHPGEAVYELQPEQGG